MILIKYNDKYLKLNEITILLLNDITFSIIIFFWFLFYKIGIIKYSPILALIITFIQNFIIIALLIYNKKITNENIIKYFFLLIIIKLLPILSFYPNGIIINITDIFIIIYIYFIYIFLLLILMKIFNIEYNIKDIVYNDINNVNYDNTIQNKLYDFTYDELIKKII